MWLPVCSKLHAKRTLNITRSQLRFVWLYNLKFGVAYALEGGMMLIGGSIRGEGSQFGLLYEGWCLGCTKSSVYYLLRSLPQGLQCCSCVGVVSCYPHFVFGVVSKTEFEDSKLVNFFGSLSPKLMQGSRVVRFAMLASKSPNEFGNLIGLIALNSLRLCRPPKSFGSSSILKHDMFGIVKPNEM